MRPEVAEGLNAVEPRIVVFVAPWALPGEEIPILAQWEPETAVTGFRLEIPEEFNVTESHNVSESSTQGGTLTATKLERPGYAAVYIKTDRIPPGVMSKNPLRISFMTVDGSEIQRTHVLSIVRPLVEFVGEGPELVLREKDLQSSYGSPPLVLRLRHTGLGVVNLQIRCRFKGLIISQNQDIIRAVVQRVMGLLPTHEVAQIAKPDESVMSMAKNAGLEVEIDPLKPESVEILYDQVMDFLSGGELPADLTSEAGLDEIKETFAHIDMDAFNELVHGQLYTLYTRYLIDGIRRYPSDFSEIQGGPAGVRVDSITNEIHVEVKYTDSQGNRYDPIETKVTVRDLREHRRPVMLPVQVDIETKLLTGLMD
jgi:hypothetical protein